MADKVDKTVVRNDHYKRGGLNKRERHNERKNVSYDNDDIVEERAVLNVHFKRCMEDGDDKVSGYAKMFDKMLADCVISTRGLTQDPYIVDELVFDVNSAYFENHGCYDYAKSFFEEAYRMAVKEIGGEQFVLSAVMHADERNSALSKDLGRDVFHYHLHVVYIPVVTKEIYFRKDNKNLELAGKLREVITQVSHSKKWPKEKKPDENGEIVLSKKGKAVLVNSYSTLQDHFFEHMRDAGFIGFERGERGSTAEHLTVLQYKSQQETERANREAERANREAERAAEMAAVADKKQEAAAALDVVIENKEQATTELEKQEKQKKKQLESLEKKTAVAKKEAATVADVESMVKPILLSGNLQISPADWKKVSNLAKEGVKSRGIIAELKKQITGFVEKIKELTKKLTKYEGLGITDTMRYYEAMQRAPRRLAETVADIKRQPSEQEQQRTTPERKCTGIGW
jgi:hypothetical protein